MSRQKVVTLLLGLNIRINMKHSSKIIFAVFLTYSIGGFLYGMEQACFCVDDDAMVQTREFVCRKSFEPQMWYTNETDVCRVEKKWVKRNNRARHEAKFYKRVCKLKDRYVALLLKKDYWLLNPSLEAILDEIPDIEYKKLKKYSDKKLVSALLEYKREARKGMLKRCCIYGCLLSPFVSTFIGILASFDINQ